MPTVNLKHTKIWVITQENDRGPKKIKWKTLSWVKAKDFRSNAWANFAFQKGNGREGSWL